ncbi:LolE-like permease protein [hydrothermal vent metagenome]|uniref:LolE-like permease protein n=1 Tax=hydrothermal vent metagenome TaxID=652676 RepID=A0A3B0ZZ55_9ZZZZ
MKLLRLAWRNVLRNVRRSLITVVAITVGLASLVFLWGLIDGMNEQMIENSTSYLTGHLKVHGKGYHEDKKLHRALTDSPAVRAEILKDNNIKALSARLAGKAMLSGANKSRGVLVVGVEPENEIKITTINKTIIEGRYLQPDDENGILIGNKMAKILGTKPGEETVLITQAADGSIGAGRYRIVGIFDTGIDAIDTNYAFLTLEAARDLYAMWGRATAWAIRLNQRQQSAQVATALSRKLGADYEVLGWRKLLPSVVQAVQFHEAMTYIILGIMFVVVGVGIANTILMAVMERTREFGVMMALGTSRSQIIGLVILESMLLGVAGIIVGNIIGLGINFYLASTGLNLEQFTAALESMPGLSAIVYPVSRWDHIAVLSAIVFFISILPALYPAWRAASVEPVEAIRGIHTHKSRHHKADGYKKQQRTRAVFWAIASRGIMRNPRRALLTAGATAFGLAAFIVLYGLIEGWYAQLVENSTRYFSAHVQIEQQGFRLDMEPELRINDYENILQKVKRAPNVAEATPRVQTRAMVSSPMASEPLLILGIDAQREQQVTQLQKVIVEGTYLAASDKNSIVLGQRVAKKLDIRIGEKVVVTAQQVTGDLGSAAYRVVGIFETGNEFFDGLMGLIPLSAGQSLLGLNNSISTIAISLKDRRDSQEFATSLNRRMGGNSGLEALPWETLMPAVVQMIEFSDVFFYIILAIVLFVIAMGIMNTLLMSVLERTREFGVMMALGTAPGQVLRIVIYESLALSAIGIIVGMVLGLVVTAYYGSTGIDLTSLMDASEAIPGMTPILKPVIIIGSFWWAAMILFATGALTAIYPAIRASHLEPVTAIRNVG